MVTRPTKQSQVALDISAERVAIQSYNAFVWVSLPKLHLIHKLNHNWVADILTKNSQESGDL